MSAQPFDEILKWHLAVYLFSATPFDSINWGCINVLADALALYIERIGELATMKSELCSRTWPNALDMNFVLKELGVSVEELKQFHGARKTTGALEQVMPKLHNSFEKALRQQHDRNSQNTLNETGSYGMEVDPLDGNGNFKRTGFFDEMSEEDRQKFQFALPWLPKLPKEQEVDEDEKIAALAASKGHHLKISAPAMSKSWGPTTKRSNPFTAIEDADYQAIAIESKLLGNIPPKTKDTTNGHIENETMKKLEAAFMTPQVGKPKKSVLPSEDIQTEPLPLQTSLFSSERYDPWSNWESRKKLKVVK